MNAQMVDLIIKKRDGGALSREEINHIIQGYSTGAIPDYQMASLLMAIFFNPLSREEIFALTHAMIKSGEVIDLSSIHGIKVDKHSTGGVGDKTSLIVGPLVAACGIPVAKMSGRGLGFTGGTIDKLEAIPGFETTKTKKEFASLVNENKLSIIGQSVDVAKADKLIYALRDVTGTVNNLGLIASSIMSKKLASGGDKILLDVKCGKGAFMETEEEAMALGEMMVEIGEEAGKETMAVVTRMEEPLGKYIGNSLEVMDAVETLKGDGFKDITQLSLFLAGAMIYLGEKAGTPQEGVTLAQKYLENGEGLRIFKKFVEAQGGNPDVVEQFRLLPQAKHFAVIKADKEGFVDNVNGLTLGLLSKKLGAGRDRKEDAISFGAGIELKKKAGDYVTKGDPLAILYSDDERKIKALLQEGRNAFIIKNQRPKAKDLIIKTITA